MSRQPIKEGGERGNMNPAPVTPKPNTPPAPQGARVTPRREILRAVKEFASWKASTAEKYADAVEELMRHGFEAQDALDLVSDLYSAVASDYGQ